MTAAVYSHLKALNLTGNPFPFGPDDTNHFVSDELSVYMVEILHTIKARKGFILVTGEVGVGKTTLSRRLLAELHEQSVETSLILNTFLQGESLLEAINEDFGICSKGKNIHELLKILNTFLLDRHAKGINCVVIIDDAQNLDPISLELVRQLSNLETGREKIIQVLLIAQPEISNVLDRHDLRQLKSRIALHVQITEFSLKEVYQYINFRLKRFGGGITLTRRALNLLYKASQGYPRLINKLMDRCLYGLVASNKREISTVLMKSAIDELQLGNNKTFIGANVLSVVVSISALTLVMLFWWMGNISFLNGLPVSLTVDMKSSSVETLPLGEVDTAIQGVNRSVANVEMFQPIRRTEAMTTATIVATAEKNEGGDNKTIQQTAPVKLESIAPTAVIASVLAENEIGKSKPIQKTALIEPEMQAVATISAVSAVSDESEKSIQNAVLVESEMQAVATIAAVSAVSGESEKDFQEIAQEKPEKKIVASAPKVMTGESDNLKQTSLTEAQAVSPVTAVPPSENLALAVAIPDQSFFATRAKLFAGSKEEKIKIAAIIFKKMRYGYESVYTEYIQMFLHEKGFYRGNIDAIMGPKTTAALALFQQSRGMDVTGVPDIKTVLVLIDLAGVPDIHSEKPIANVKDDLK